MPRASRLMRLVPGLGPTGLDDERDRELAMWRACTLHDGLYKLSCCFHFGFWRLEQKLVMDLQQHASMQLFAGECGRDTGHRALDDVCGRALKRRIDRLPLGAGPARRVCVADPRDEAFAPEDRLDIAGAPAVGLDPLHIGADRREAVEIGADIGRRLALRDANLRPETKGADAVDDAEIDRLRPPPGISV